MSTDQEFSLQEFAVDLWDELGNCDQFVLAKEIALRVPPHQRLRALEEAALAFAGQVVRAQRRGRAVKMPLKDRLERRTERVGDCLIWTGKTASNGYGQITISNNGRRLSRRVHRVSYEEFVGPIPPGYEIDHQCHSQDPDACRQPCIHILCWNPDHLRAVTRLENMRCRRTRSRCKNGHEFTPDNIYRAPGTPLIRRCLACRELKNLTRVRPERTTQTT